MSNNIFETANALVDKWGQQHLLRFYDRLSDYDKAALLQSILSVDFPRIMGLYRRAAVDPAEEQTQRLITPISAIAKSEMTPDELESAMAIGMEAVSQGRYAVVTMAGGQGTRLGHNGPKGTLMVPLELSVSLFELQLAQIKRLSAQAGTPVPWYIMTSVENHEATVAFFEHNRYFGYEHISFFRQSSLPMIGLDGKLLMDSRFSIKEGPDGNGTIFRSLLRSGVAADMARRGVRWFLACNVDNILARCGDPLPIGLAVVQGVPVVSKSVMKRSPDEKAGVFCRIDGKPAVVEYSEITSEMANRTDSNGSLVFGDAHISCTLFSTEVLGLVEREDMPYHAAVKKAPFMDETGELVTPQKENAYKFEAFIFDIFPRCGDIAVLRVKREEEFAPIKNATGEDSLETAKELYMNCQRE